MVYLLWGPKSITQTYFWAIWSPGEWQTGAPGITWSQHVVKASGVAACKGSYVGPETILPFLKLKKANMEILPQSLISGCL